MFAKEMRVLLPKWGFNMKYNAVGAKVKISKKVEPNYGKFQNHVFVLKIN